jgi:hypothetical protein
LVGWFIAYCHASWVRYETLLAAWRGDWCGNDAAGAYRGYVEAGVSDPPRSPFRETFGGRVLGSTAFIERLRALAGPASSDPPLREARQLAALDAGAVLSAVTEYYDLDEGSLTRRHDRHIARAMAAWLCRRHTEATLRELASRLGLSRADSVPSLVRRLESRLASSPRLLRDVAEIERLLSAGTARGVLVREEPVSPQGRRPRNRTRNPFS